MIGIRSKAWMRSPCSQFAVPAGCFPLSVHAWEGFSRESPVTHLSPGLLTASPPHCPLSSLWHVTLLNALFLTLCPTLTCDLTLSSFPGTFVAVFVSSTPWCSSEFWKPCPSDFCSPGWFYKKKKKKRDSVISSKSTRLPVFYLSWALTPSEMLLKLQFH